MPKVLFAPLIHEIRGRMGGSVWKKTKFSRRIILESYPRRGDPVDPNSLAFSQQKSYALADLQWQLMNRAERKVWNDAVKRPYLTGQALWMQEAMTLLVRSKCAPDVPSISGGFNPRKAIEGTKLRQCPPPLPPPGWIFLRFAVGSVTSSNSSWKCMIFFVQNPLATDFVKSGATLWIFFGYNPLYMPPYLWDFMFGMWNEVDGWWYETVPPHTRLEGDHSEYLGIPKRYELSGVFAVSGPNCHAQDGGFSEGHDWEFTPPSP